MERTKKMRHFALFIIFLGLAFNIAVFTFDRSTEDEITFYFNPPDSTFFIETLRHTQAIAEGLQQPEEQIKEQKTEYVIRKTNTGFSVFVTPLLPEKKASEDLSAILTSIASTLALTYDLDTQGRLIGVRGTEVASERLKQLIPEEMLSLIFLFLGQGGKSLEQLAMNGWNDRAMLGFFAGRTFVLNKVYTETLDVPLSVGGTMPALTTLKISQPVTCDGHRCAEILFSYESNDSAIGEKMTDLLKDMFMKTLDMFKLPEVEEVKKQIPDFIFSNPKILYEDKRLTDPKTGLLYSEIETRTFHGLLGVNKEDLSRFTIKEMKEYRYEYKEKNE
jgi:hypothetical protein